MDNFFGMLQLAIGVYLIYCAIFGRGMIYKNENIKKGMEELYKKRMRLFSYIIGPLMIATGLVEYLFIESEHYLLLFYITWGLSAIAIGALVVCTMKMTDRTKRNSPTMSAPKGAFEFDEDDKDK